MEPEVDCIRQQNNQTLNLCNMHLEIGKIKKEYLDLYGYQGSMQHQECLEFLNPHSLMDCQKKI